MSDRRRLPLAARLPFPAMLALRYLRSTRRDSFISFLSVVATSSIALGVAALIIALAALSGFQEALSSEIVARTPALRITPPGAADEAGIRAAVAELPGVLEVQWSLSGSGWLISEGRVRPVAIEGFEGRLPSTYPGAAGAEPGLYMADVLARNWRLDPGAWLEVASNRPTLTPLGPQPRVLRMPLRGTFQGGRTEQQDRIAVPLAEARRLLAPARPRLLVATADLERALEVAVAATAVLPEGTEIVTWKDLNRPLFFALRLEKGVMFLAVSLIVLVGALALVTDLELIISTKRAEIGMLAAMGADAGDLRQAFLLLAGMLVALGCCAGAATGVGASWLLGAFQLISLPNQVYFLDHVPFLVRPLDLLAVVGVTALLATSFALSAAGRAARLLPVEALRR